MVDTLTVQGLTGANASEGSALAQMFADDAKGTLGYLKHPYQDGAAIFQYVAAANTWVLRKRVLDFMAHGNGEIATEIGFTTVQDDDSTSLLKGGFASSTSYYCIQGIALRMSGLGYAPTSVSGAGGGAVLVEADTVSRIGIVRNDCIGIAGEFIKAYFENSYLEYFQQSRKCFALLGKADQFPQGLGVTALSDVTNGLVGKCNQEKFKRTLISPPSNTNTLGYIIRLTSNADNALSIPADPSFAAPADGAICVFKLQLSLSGYFCDQTGFPLITPTDIAEATQANGECQ